MKEEIKQKYLALISSVESSQPILKSLEKFVDDYSGEYKPSFHQLIMETVALAIQLDELQLKAEGYDEINKIEKNYVNKMRELAKKLDQDEENLNVPVPA